MARVPHPIEVESYRRMRALVDFSALAPLSRAVAERVVHASADPDYVDDLVLDEGALEVGRAALAGEAPLVVDVRMVAAGIPAATARCGFDEAGATGLAAGAGLTRSAAAMRLALEAAGDGAVVAVGNAPTALFEVLRLAASGRCRPAFVVGLPVGFVDAVEAKAALRAAPLPSLTNRGRKGGSAVAAAAVNALLYADEEPHP